MLGDEGDILVGAHEDGYPALFHALVQQPVDGVECQFEHPLVVVVVFGQQGHFHISLVPSCFGQLLADVPVGFAQFLGSGGVGHCEFALLHLGNLLEYLVVELHYPSAGTVVVAERLHADGKAVAKGSVDIVEQRPVASAPSVDALFHVAYNQVVGVGMAHALAE